MSEKFTKELIFVNQNKIENPEKKINVIHFTDSYCIDSQSIEPVGGCSRFMTVLQHLKKQGPNVILFSGNAISPSHGSYHIF